MTYTILAINPIEKLMGIGVVSGSIGVGERVPWGISGVGIAATQCYTNIDLGRISLRYLSEGYSVREALAKALETDPGKEHRQLALLSVNGEGAAYTGIHCPKHMKSIIRKNVVSIGNLLSSEKVVDTLVEKYLNSNEELPRRILNALLEASKLGGDSRGDRTSALIIYDLYPDKRHIGPRINLHIKKNKDPVRKLFEEYLKLYWEEE